MGRGPLTWIVGIVVGVVVVLGVTALIGREDDSGEPVPAGVWAQNVCGAVGVWRGELESLVVADHARGSGIGTQLIETARELLHARRVQYWSVAVVEANEGAVRLYERSGFRPYYRQLLGRVAEDDM